MKKGRKELKMSSKHGNIKIKIQISIRKKENWETNQKERKKLWDMLKRKVCKKKRLKENNIFKQFRKKKKSKIIKKINKEKRVRLVKKESLK